LKAFFRKYQLKFRFDAGTSRGVLRTRESWFLFLEQENSITGIGECAPLKGLSIDDGPGLEDKLNETCMLLNKGDIPTDLHLFPSLRFGLEMAQMDLKNGGKRVLYPSRFTEGSDSICINGLVWMGGLDFMKQQIREKIAGGFHCIKLKIGALNFDEELGLIKEVRKEFGPDDIEIRVDANGAFTTGEAPDKLKRLAELKIHSIEQPIRAGHWDEMAALCSQSPLPIALDEELIGWQSQDDKIKLLSTIRPQYIILKPGLLGGFAACNEWINMAEANNAGWWITSALESNIGLNALAQWTFTLGNELHQGLGTGQLYSNNFDSPLFIENGLLRYDPHGSWNLKNLWNAT
jgi:o-succinylbenzoate synthase